MFSTEDGKDQLERSARVGYREWLDAQYDLIHSGDLRQNTERAERRVLRQVEFYGLVAYHSLEGLRRSPWLVHGIFYGKKIEKSWCSIFFTVQPFYLRFVIVTTFLRNIGIRTDV